MSVQGNLCCRNSITEQLFEQIDNPPFSLDGGEKRLLRFEVGVARADVLQWLASQQIFGKLYFSDRQSYFETAGVGCADILTDADPLDLTGALAVIEKNMETAQGQIRYYGGICFDLADDKTGWDGFGRFCFVVPEFELLRENGETRFAYNIICTEQDNTETIKKRFSATADRLIFNEANESTLYSQQTSPVRISSRRDVPDKTKWEQNVTEVISRLNSNQVQKVVLSRKSILETSDAIDPLAILKQVKENSINTYDFCFQLDRNSAFIGCSPECLYKRHGSNIFSEAIAGSCPAGKNDKENEAFQQDMIDSAKETEEHDYVFENIKTELENICEEVGVISKKEILVLSYIQHFCSRFRGVLKKDISTFDILRALHPTAAVNGFPKHRSLELIRKLEPYSRGWYAGPVGWIGRSSSEFAVAIRSGFIQGNQITLFAGAGIVKDSDPTREWEEMENKLKLLLEVMDRS